MYVNLFTYIFLMRIVQYFKFLYTKCVKVKIVECGSLCNSSLLSNAHAMLLIFLVCLGVARTNSLITCKKGMTNLMQQSITWWNRISSFYNTYGCQEDIYASLYCCFSRPSMWDGRDDFVVVGFLLENIKIVAFHNGMPCCHIEVHHCALEPRKAHSWFHMDWLILHEN